MLLSLIIPIYNVEKYIEECLESVCCQLVAGVEVILVNDGTPDSSMLIARKYISERYNHLKEQFVFIDQENQGLSAARNIGIQEAKGEYLMFLDSDDILEEKCLSQIFKILEENEVDLIQFKAYRFKDPSKEKLNFMPDSPFIGNCLIDDDILKFVFNTSNWFSWLRVYHKKLFKDRAFPVCKFYEDAYTTPFVFLDSKSIFFSNEYLLGYRFNDQGITAKITDKTLEDLRGLAEIFADNTDKCKYFSLSLISISRYYITQSLTAEGLCKALNRWKLLRNEIDKSNFDSSILINLGDKLFYKYGFVFLLLHKIFINLRGKMKEIVE